MARIKEVVEMIYKLTVKVARTDDYGSMHLEPPNDGTYHPYLPSLAEDIHGLSCVKSVTRHGTEFVIEVIDGVTQKELKNAMKPFFSGSRFDTTRFLSLQQANSKSCSE